MHRDRDLLPAVAAAWQAAAATGAAGPGGLVAGVSGGPDSLALLHLLHRLAPSAGLALQVAHLDHGWRADGPADAGFVAATCAAWGLPCTCARFDVPAYAAAARLSPEDAARRVRYTFLAGVAAAAGARAVAVGHQADDQVETVVGHWLRGAGLPGLAGMAPWAPLPLPPDAPALAAALGVPFAPAGPLWLLRPLLAVGRAAIAAYCAAAGLAPREDVTNQDPAHRRNYLRRTLIPLLEAAQPGFGARIVRSAAVFADEDALLESLLDSGWPALAQERADGVRLALPALAALPPALARRALRRAAETVAANLQGPGAVHIEAALRLLGPAGQTGATLPWPAGVVVRRERDALWIARPGAPAAPADWPRLAPGEVRPLPAEGVVPLGGYRLIVARRPLAAGLPEAPGPWRAWFDAAALLGPGAPPLVLRTRRPGDQLRPWGLGGRHRKVQDVLVDGGVPRAARATLPLLAQAGGEVLWVPGPGGRRSLLAPVGPATQDVVIFEFVREGVSS